MAPLWAVSCAAKKKLKWGLIIGGALLVFCLLMLAANAALTYVVVSMSKDTSVQTSGVMTDKSGSTVVGERQRQPGRWLAGCLDLSRHTLPLPF